MSSLANAGIAARFIGVSQAAGGLSRAASLPGELHGQWRDVPDVFTVLAHRAVRGKVSAAAHVEDGHPGPAVLVTVCEIDPRLTIDVVAKFGTHEERIERSADYWSAGGTVGHRHG